MATAEFKRFQRPPKAGKLVTMQARGAAEAVSKSQAAVLELVCRSEVK